MVDIGADVKNVLATVFGLPEEEFYPEFESLRDDLLAALRDRPQDLARIYELAQQSPPMQRELLATVLADKNYAPAVPWFVQLLNSSNEEQLRFVALLAIDGYAGGMFNGESVLDGGWVQQDRIDALVPQIEQWWQKTGQHQGYDDADWVAKERATPPKAPVSEFDKRLNFMMLNPSWAMLADGVVTPDGKNLPRGQGVHLIAGTGRLPDTAQPQLVAALVDASSGTVQNLFAKVNDQWVNVTGHVRDLTLDYRMI